MGTMIRRTMSSLGALAAFLIAAGSAATQATATSMSAGDEPVARLPKR